MPGRDDLIAVRADDAQRLIEELGDTAYELVETASLPDDVLEMLQIGYFAVSRKDPSSVDQEVVSVGQTAARLGYLVRAVEFDRFETARVADLDLMERMEEWLADPEFGGSDSTADTFIEAAARMAMSEPIDPGPNEPAMSWVVPGLGGDVRGMLRDYVLQGVGLPGPDGLPRLPAGVERDELRRAWKYGFFLRVLMECLNEDRLH